MAGVGVAGVDVAVVGVAGVGVAGVGVAGVGVAGGGERDECAAHDKQGGHGLCGGTRDELRRGFNGGTGISSGSRRSLPVRPDAQTPRLPVRPRRDSSTSAFGHESRQHTGR